MRARHPLNAAAVMQEYGSDPDFLAAFGSCGIHYPCGRVCDEALTKAGKACWASEDLWTQPTWGGSVCWATEFNMNFILSNMTSTLAWATVWSAYPNVDVFEGAGDPISGDGFWGPGLLYAWQPWSGHYAIPNTVWASAHTTQFTEVGWDIPFHGAGYLMSGGSFLTMINPSNASEFTVIIETASAACHRCHSFCGLPPLPQLLRPATAATRLLVGGKRPQDAAAACPCRTTVQDAIAGGRVHKCDAFFHSASQVGAAGDGGQHGDILT